MTSDVYIASECDCERCIHEEVCQWKKERHGQECVYMQEPCDDAISREAVLDLCDSTDPEYKVVHFKEDVECLPSVRPQETKTGLCEVLDKIRAEIAEYKDDKIIHDERNEMIDIVLEIIDKYRAESEEV